MIDRQALLGDLRRQLRLLERDLTERTESMPEMAGALEAQPGRYGRAGETSGPEYLCQPSRTLPWNNRRYGGEL